MTSHLASRFHCGVGHFVFLCAAAVAISAALPAPSAAHAAEPKALAERIERAHGVEAWRQRTGVAANLLNEITSPAARAVADSDVGFAAVTRGRTPSTRRST